MLHCSGRGQRMDHFSHFSKTVWRERKETHRWSFYCPLCATSRTISAPARPGTLQHIWQITLSSAFFTVVSWPLFGWKGIVSIVPFWAVFELVYRLRMRARLGCPNCGFDPYLYRVDVARAKQVI